MYITWTVLITGFCHMVAVMILISLCFQEEKDVWRVLHRLREYRDCASQERMSAGIIRHWTVPSLLPPMCVGRNTAGESSKQAKTPKGFQRCMWKIAWQLKMEELCEKNSPGCLHKIVFPIATWLVNTEGPGPLSDSVVQLGLIWSVAMGADQILTLPSDSVLSPIGIQHTLCLCN